MNELIKFIKSIDLEKDELFIQLKCNLEEGKILQHLTKEYINGRDALMVIDILSEFYDVKKYEHLHKLEVIKSLLELGWLVQNSFTPIKLSEISKLELLNSSVSLTPSFLKLMEDGSMDMSLPEVTKYSDHLEYLQDQFFKIDLAQKLNVVKHNFDEKSPNIKRLKSKLTLLENRIKERVQATPNEIMLVGFFKENDLNEQEQMIFIALLKEEYSGGDESIRDMNSLIDLISHDDYEKIKNRSLLEESSKLVSTGLVDYDEMLTPFGGINRNFYIPDEVLYKISHPTKKKSRTAKIKIDNVIKEQDMFELISTDKTMEDVVLNPKTRETLDALLQQVDKKVINRLKEWGIKDRTKSEPILLLNEADQFLSSRVTESTSGSDKMHNQMQNIFLEQIERFDGILIATTNLLESLDKAFSRRFNYKIEFVKPNKEQRLEIWKKLLPENIPLDKNFDINKISEVELTGGQIELIIKNTAYKVAVMDEPIFKMEDFQEQISKEQKSQFDQENKVGFF